MLIQQPYNALKSKPTQIIKKTEEMIKVSFAFEKAGYTEEQSNLKIDITKRILNPSL